MKADYAWRVGEVCFRTNCENANGGPGVYRQCPKSQQGGVSVRASLVLLLAYKPSRGRYYSSTEERNISSHRPIWTVWIVAIYAALYSVNNEVDPPNPSCTLAEGRPGHGLGELQCTAHIISICHGKSWHSPFGTPLCRGLYL